MSLDLSAIITVEPKKKGGKTYPSLPDPAGEIAALVDQAKVLHDEIKQREAGLEIRKNKIKAVAIDYALRSQHRAAAVANTFKAKGTTAEATVSFANKYRLPEDTTQLKAVLGDTADRFIRERHEITIDTAKIPEDLQQAFVNFVVETAQMMEVLDAVSASKVVALSPGFHEERHQYFDPAKNLAINEIMPMTVSVRIG
jgi:hypothetical protein